LSPIFFGGRCPQHNYVIQIWWQSVKGFRVGWGSNLTLSHWLWWSALQHSHTTVWACDLCATRSPCQVHTLCTAAYCVLYLCIFQRQFSGNRHLLRSAKVWRSGAKRGIRRGLVFQYVNFVTSVHCKRTYRAGGTGPVGPAMAGPTFWQNYKFFVSTRHISGRHNFRSLQLESFWGAEICLECVGGLGSAPDPAGGAHDAPPRPPSRLGRGTPPPKEPHPPRRLRRSMLGTFGASFLAYTHLYF